MDSKSSHSTFLMELHTRNIQISQPDGTRACFFIAKNISTLLMYYLFYLDVITLMKSSLQKYIPGDAKEVYRRGDESSLTCVLGLAGNHLATIRLRSSGLILLNLDMSSGSDFTYEVSSRIASFFLEFFINFLFLADIKAA